MYIGCKILNFRQEEVLAMTLRKFFLLYDEHLEITGQKEREVTVDQVF
ncbi:MAG: hypothetical protein HFI80_11195 [Lachnospiraceae bacterium]|nr:hypothetical protein [Lachnospiraceae bacterium]